MYWTATWLTSKTDLSSISGIKLLVRCDEWPYDACKIFPLPFAILFWLSGTIWKQMGLTSFPKLLVKSVLANQELNLHSWPVCVWFYASILIILTTDGTQENTKHFPCHKSYHSLEMGARKSSNIYWDGSVELGLPKKTGVQWFLEQVWAQNPSCAWAHVTTFLCVWLWISDR